MRGQGTTTTDADQILYGSADLRGERGGFDVRFRFEQLADGLEELDELLWVDIEVPDEYFECVNKYIALAREHALPGDDPRAETAVKKIYQIVADNLVEYGDLAEHQQETVVTQALELALADHKAHLEQSEQLLSNYVYGQLRTTETGIAQTYSDWLFELHQQVASKQMPSLVVPSEQWLAGTAAKHYKIDGMRSTLCGNHVFLRDGSWTALSSVINGKLETQATCKRCLAAARKRGAEIAVHGMAEDEHYAYLRERIRPEQLVSLLGRHDDAHKLRTDLEQVIWEQMIEAMIFEVELTIAEKQRLKQLRPGDRVPEL